MSIIEKARALRKNMTPQEKRVWLFLKQQRFQGLRFRRQAPIGPYIADFLCLNPRLIIEIDGGQHNIAEHQTYDKKEQIISRLKVTRFFVSGIARLICILNQSWRLFLMLLKII